MRQGLIAALVLCSGLYLYMQLQMHYKLQQQEHRHQTAYAALQEELERTRSNVLQAAQNAAESRRELRSALQTEEEWSATEVPSSIRRSLSPSRL